MALTLDKVSKKKNNRSTGTSPVSEEIPATIKQEEAISPWKDFSKPVDLLDLILERKLSKKAQKTENENE